MRTRTVRAVVALLLVGCGEKVTNHIDALRESGAWRYTRSRLSSSEALGSYRSWLRKDEHARAILDAGEAAVPELVLLLDDSERRTLAAVFLGEIKGEQPATALLGHWRGLRGKAKKKVTHYSTERLGRSVTESAGARYEGVDHEFYDELIHALCLTGRPVSAAVAADTRAAMDEAERRHRAGEDLHRKEEPGEIELRWEIEPVETACEGLQILAMVHAPEAPPLFTRALRSPVRSFRWTGVHEFIYIGEGVKQTFPALGDLLDDPDWREEVMNSLSLLLPDLPHPLWTNQTQEELARRYKQRLRELQ